MVSFVTTKPAEAKGFLASFLDQTPQRLADLRDQCASQGGPAPHMLDLSAESLDPLWAWAKPRLSWREGYQPGQSWDQPASKIPCEDIEPLEALPDWYDYDRGDWEFSASTLWLIDGLARYLGECFPHNIPGTRWKVGKNRHKRYIYQNQPVITGLAVDDSQPMAGVTILTSRALNPSRGPSTLTDLYTVWTVPPTPPPPWRDR